MYKAIEKVQLARRVRQLEKQLEQKYTFSRIIGKSRRIMEAIELGKRVAPSDTTVLLLGETGTGKEVNARRSNRSGQYSGPGKHVLLSPAVFGIRSTFIQLSAEPDKFATGLRR